MKAIVIYCLVAIAAVAFFGSSPARGLGVPDSEARSIWGGQCWGPNGGPAAPCCGYLQDVLKTQQVGGPELPKTPCDDLSDCTYTALGFGACGS